MKSLPFKIGRETPMENYRARSFWSKEPETLAWIESFDPRDIFFDIGANVGVYTLFRASLHPGGVIYAFEPSMVNYQALMSNIEKNKFSYISAFPICIGNHEGDVSFDDPDEVGASGGQMHAGKNFRPLRTIDSFAVWPAHVKIDIDGQELEVVKGMHQSMKTMTSARIEVSKASKKEIMTIMTFSGFTTDNRFNRMSPHSRTRRAAEGIDAENIIFTRP